MMNILTLGTWEARYTLGRDPGTGNQVRKSVYGKTQKEVRQKLSKVTVALDEGTHLEPSKLTLGAWLDMWISELCRFICEAIYASFIYPYMRSLYQAATGGNQTNCARHLYYPEILQRIIQRRRKHLVTKDREEHPRGTASGVGAGREAGAYQSKPIRRMYPTLPRATKKEIKPLDEQQIAEFITAMQGHEHETLYMLTLFTGMRQSEVLGCRWQCVDFDNSTILINAQLQKDYSTGKYVFVPYVKNDKARTIAPAASIMALLHEHKRKQASQRELAQEAWEESDYVFTNELGQHLKHVTVYKNYKRILATLGIDARFHDLRHNYAVVALQSGDDVKAVQENLGHHTAAFTLDVYGHYTERMKRESAQRMETFITGVKSSKG